MTGANKQFRQVLKDTESYPILYELLPPPKTEEKNGIEAFFHAIDRILGDTNVDAINIPEVRDETGQTKKKGVQTVTKADPRVFAKDLLKHKSDVTVVVNHVVVHDPPDQFHAWVRETDEEYGIQNVIVVGGESADIDYQGPTVTEASTWIRDTYNKDLSENEKMLVGGIMIPTRRLPDADFDEPERLIEKANEGIDFFTSQVIYESTSTKKILADYATLCMKRGVEPKRLFLSFAPVSTKKDIQFLRWLGVNIDKGVERELNEGWIGMGWRSVEICRNILGDILHFMREQSIKVPIGINVEHVMKYNVELSKELLISLTDILKQHNR